MYYPERVEIIEVGLRDGIQKEKKILSVDEKLKLIHAIEDSGVKYIQVGSFVHPKAVPQMSNTDEVFRILKPKEGIEYSNSPIPNLRAFERSIACGCHYGRISVSVSYGHNMANFRCAPEVTLHGFEEIVKKAKACGYHLGTGLMMAFGSPWEGNIPLSEIKKYMDIYMNWGLTEEVMLADTAGLGNPALVYNTCHSLKEMYPQVKKWTLHLHNTRGNGIANMLAGIEAGVTRFETSFAGMGGCPFVPSAAGNISTEDAVYTLEEMGIRTGIDIDKSIKVGKLAEEMLEKKGDSYLIKAGTGKYLLK